MKKIILIILLVVVAPLFLVKAQTNGVFKAKVIEVLEQKEKNRDDGSHYIQQNIKLIGLEGEWKDKEIFFYGIDDLLDVVASSVYKAGDKVYVMHTEDFNGHDLFLITDYVRTSPLYILFFLFAILVITIGRWKGFRSLIVLFLTFIVIIKYVIPKIFSGSDPLSISIIGSIIILFMAVYITEGFNRKSNIIIISLIISLLITGIIALFSVWIMRLTGTAQEEILYLIDIGAGTVNLKGLLLAGIIIGTLGVLDDIVISQVSVVEELKKQSLNASDSQIYKNSLKIGVAHISSMINTLFLAYAGASLPLLMLFSFKNEPFLTFSGIINNELIATEIIRTLSGSIGIVLAVPIATLLAVKFIRLKK